MAMNTAEMNKGELVLGGLCKSDSRYPTESMPEGTHFMRCAKVRKVKDGMTEWKKKSKMSSQKKRKSACMHVAEKVLQSTGLLKIHILVHCILLVEMV